MSASQKHPVGPPEVLTQHPFRPLSSIPSRPESRISRPTSRADSRPTSRLGTRPEHKQGEVSASATAAAYSVLLATC